MSLSSPNKIVWTFFRSMARLESELKETKDDIEIKDKAVIAIVVSVSAVEAFLNVFFRVLVEDEKYHQHKEMVVSDLNLDNTEQPKGLKYKLNNWPNKILKKNVNLNIGIGKHFDDLRIKRNSLIHYRSDYGVLSLPNVKIEGLMNTECFDSLDKMDVINSYKIAMGFIGHILSLSGVKESEIKNAIHAWTGLPPNLQD